MKVLKEKVKAKGNDFNLKVRNTRKLTLFDDESTKMIIIFIYEGYGVKNITWILSNSRG